jgi:hypothetical protein
MFDKITYDLYTGYYSKLDMVDCRSYNYELWNDTRRLSLSRLIPRRFDPFDPFSSLGLKLGTSEAIAIVSKNAPHT